MPQGEIDMLDKIKDELERISVKIGQLRGYL
jgi:hypothetical protein